MNIQNIHELYFLWPNSSVQVISKLVRFWLSNYYPQKYDQKKNISHFSTKYVRKKKKQNRKTNIANRRATIPEAKSLDNMADQRFSVFCKLGGLCPYLWADTDTSYCCVRAVST